jgi:hypothetical protein
MSEFTHRQGDFTISPLVSYAIDGLRRCWQPEKGRYSYRYKFDSGGSANDSVVEGDAFYTLNVLLGFSRLPAILSSEHGNTEAIYEGCCRESGNPKFKTYALGMALWAGAELGLRPPQPLVERVSSILSSTSALRGLTAQDIGMLASGAIAMTAIDGMHWRRAADLLLGILRDNYHHPVTHLFYNRGRGLRRQFSSFASQVYAMLALYQYGEAFGADWAIGLANATAAAVISLQGPRGEWAWFYYVPAGRVVDFYEVYSVHQHGMAPAFLRHAVRHGISGARAALVKGFGWLFHDNEMGVTMLRPVERMFYRSQFRQGELQTIWPRARRSVVNALLERSDSAANHRGLVLRMECRSYELGWILWSFGGRSDYRDLTERPEFAV